MRNLVIVMAGDRSLHHEIASSRDYELWTIYYGDDDGVYDTYRQFSDRSWRAKGLKVELVRRVLLEQLHFTREVRFEDYDYIFMPDDDIRFPAGAADVSRLFEVCAQIGADVFQPAISNEFYSKAWESTRLIEGAACHRVNIVEVMMHGFSGKAFVHGYLSAIHSMQFMKSGWGVEPVSMKAAEVALNRQLKTFVIDAVPAIHTRPIGGGAPHIHALGNAEAALLPQIHVNRMRTLKVFDTLEAAAAEPDGQVEVSVEVSPFVKPYRDKRRRGLSGLINKLFGR
ncbi:MAG: hypothetical protein QM645_14260 [Asticcacaulis sp.]